MKKYLIFATLVAMVFVGCKKNTTAPPKKPADNRVAAKFSGNILKNEVKTTTRVTGNTWDQGDEVGMFAFKEGSRANSGLLCSNYKFNAKKNGELEEVTGLMYFPSGGEKVDFIAYHPYHSNLNLGTPSQWITFKPEHPLNKMECLWASANGQSEASPKVNFEFKRLQSSVTFILKATSEHEYTVDSDITLTDMPYKAFFDVVKGTLVASTETSGISDLKGLKYNRLYYLPPHEAKKHTTRSIVVTTREKKALSVPIKFDFESGKTHIITVFLGKDGYKLSLESTVVPFEDSGEITLKPIGLINNK